LAYLICWDGTLDLSKRVFVEMSCYQDKEMKTYVLTRLERLGFSKNKMVEGLNLDLARTGDYYIRCGGADVLISKMSFNGNDISLERLGKFSFHQPRIINEKSTKTTKR
jgi:hypothetical protein